MKTALFTKVFFISSTVYLSVRRQLELKQNKLCRQPCAAEFAVTQICASKHGAVSALSSQQVIQC